MKIDVIIGDYKFELKSFKKVCGHDDSLPFVGKLYVNGKCIAECSNDGWGGDANIYPNDKNINLYNKVKEYIKDKKYDGFDAELPYIADSLAAREYDYRSVKRYMKKNLVFSKDYMYKIVPIVDRYNHKEEIAKLLLSEDGKSIVYHIIDKYERQGYVCINDFYTK